MRDLPPLKTLPVFLSVCHHLNFTKAAEELCITHSAVSQNIQNLESFLGKKLINRTTRHMELTAEGERYRQSIEEGMNLIVRATQREMQSDKQVYLNSIPTLALKWLIPRLPNFTTAHPDIELRLSAISLSDFDIDADNLDLAIGYGNSPDWWPDSVAKEWCQDQLLLVGRPSVLEKYQSIEEILQNETQIWVKDRYRSSDWKQWADAKNLPLGSKAKKQVFENSTQAIQAAIAGVGIFVTHNIFVTDELSSGLLKNLAEPAITIDSWYYILCRPDKVRSKNVKTVIDWLMEEVS
ncbi:LysR substrate-binding domain-containing protein [Vibrio marisflavi]|uniref:Glycine cleavage system transcriptional activator n=1 Tax=Vibrio marisflavi CECT 7928 TaxID=634439 RepID=A0ABM9A1I7_9VIBR|nr:LysR substrate-binding domain-containing protein [Vibrio marisflavi]CAH0537663.1 Glycine cleavage system transcriptional activator [Vibrio marisflavi CECT 7928]